MDKKTLQKFANSLWIPKTECDAIIMTHLQVSKTELFLLSKIDNKCGERIISDFKKRANGEPLEYIIKKAYFFSLEFFVDKRVLIPRNETEMLIKKVTEIKNLETYTLIDVWTWSSAIAVSIIKNTKIWFANAIDISKDALEVAKINIAKYNLEDKIHILQSDLLSEVLQKNSLEKYFYDSKSSSEWQIEKNIIITANLPYIKNSDFENMSPETLKFEPHLALFWWKDTGFELYEKLIWQIFELQKKYNIKTIILFIEIGFDQKEIAKNFLHNVWLRFEIYTDNSQIDRCIKIFFDF